MSLGDYSTYSWKKRQRANKSIEWQQVPWVRRFSYFTQCQVLLKRNIEKLEIVWIFILAAYRTPTVWWQIHFVFVCQFNNQSTIFFVAAWLPHQTFDLLPFEWQTLRATNTIHPVEWIVWNSPHSAFCSNYCFRPFFAAAAATEIR